jgi:deoxyribodipyrimidine photo-lyase
MVLVRKAGAPNEENRSLSVPAGRIFSLNGENPNPAGSYVLYWMVAARRPTWNFALQHARDCALKLGKPLLLLEGLRSDYRWASDRMHRFVIDGMADHAREFARRRIAYLAYVESEPGAGRGLLETLAKDACLVVTDDYPAFFLPRMLQAAGGIPVRLTAVDSNGLLPLRASGRPFPSAYGFRRFLQKELPRHLEERPERDPLARAPVGTPGLLTKTLRRWPVLGPETKSRNLDALISRLPVDHGVQPVPYKGGYLQGARELESFVTGRLAGYTEKRNDPTEPATSGLSPYLHFGHVGAHQVFESVIDAEGWSAAGLSTSTAGKRLGWWGMSEAAESFLDQLVTWRELGFNKSALSPEHDRFESLPEWSRRTLRDHATDLRPYLYEHKQLEAAETHDPIWNAAQRQLLREGRIHGYLRMLWGKKILEWSETPRRALSVMIELNNRWAVDGRDPNSYSGIFWVLGRYDRAWGPERPIFGKVRYMTSENTARKYKLDNYLDRYGDGKA